MTLLDTNRIEEGILRIVQDIARDSDFDVACGAMRDFSFDFDVTVRARLDFAPIFLTSSQLSEGVLGMEVWTMFFSLPGVD